jgi:hypothetical protein
VTDALARVLTPEERELSRYLDIIEAKKREVADFQAEIEALNDDLSRFNAEYYSRVGTLLVEIDKLELEEAELRRRLELLQRDDSPGEEAVDEQVKVEFSQRRRRIDEEEADANQYQEQARRFHQDPQLTPQASADIKRLFRELAKRFHPDLARTDQERIERTRLMQQITSAFHAHDLDALQKLSTTQDVEDRSFDRLSIAEKLVWAIREVARLDELAIQLAQEIIKTNGSALGILWGRVKQGQNPLGELETELNRKLTIAQMKLESVIHQHHQLRNERPR